ncbi:hypothetical protein GCM10025883_29790 [Mobilicoccus caccae]|uniref:Major facilitator superfamily (MFS) profile domain-containing protein n=1 Tax=Mobilicoccus caccae TaxID=1859295 RepID=A0ABQ6IW42_9MICO|nr:hypothetical protein GCM10025883_29790 [Mobilicoccus caccae]
MEKGRHDDALAVLGIDGTYFGFALIGAVALVFILVVPETRGRSLERLEEEATDGTIFRSNLWNTLRGRVSGRSRGDLRRCGGSTLGSRGVPVGG